VSASSQQKAPCELNLWFKSGSGYFTFLVQASPAVARVGSKTRKNGFRRRSVATTASTSIHSCVATCCQPTVN